MPVIVGWMTIGSQGVGMQLLKAHGTCVETLIKSTFI